MEYRGQCRVTARPPRFVWTVDWYERYRDIALQYEVTEEIIASALSTLGLPAARRAYR